MPSGMALILVSSMATGVGWGRRSEGIQVAIRHCLSPYMAKRSPALTLQMEEH